MTITRRRLVTGAAAATAGGLLLPRDGWAPPPPPTPKKGVWAVKFASTRIQNDGTIYGMPATTQSLTWVYTFRTTNRGSCTLFWQGAPSSGNAVCDVQHFSPGGNKPPMPSLQFSIWDAPGGTGHTLLWGNTASGSIPCDGNWHTMILNANLVAHTMKIKLDGVPLTVGINGYWNGAMPCNVSASGAPLRWSVGSHGTAAAYYTGDLAELYLFTDPIDSDDPNVVYGMVEAVSGERMGGFIDQATGKPVRNSDDGWTALGPYLGISPKIYLSGSKTKFGSNPAPRAAASTYDWTNSVDTSPPSSFYTAMGALQVPTADPWGFTGV